MTMSIDKFGSHIIGRDNKFKFSEPSPNNIVKIVDIGEIKLFYYMALPFMGIYNRYNINADDSYELLQDRSINYIFPVESATIVRAEYPKKYIIFKVNGLTITNPVDFPLKKGDIISFHRPLPELGGILDDFYGELLIKCAVEVTK